MNYSPKDFYVWDAWCMAMADEVHVYHLQAKRPGAGVPDEAAAQLGHAVSRDLITWDERPACFGPDPNNPVDNSQPWTGCALWHEDQGYLYYTMRGVAQDGTNIQRIGLATSPDGQNWTRYRKNPIIVPDRQWYATAHSPVPGTLDCRDLIVVTDPRGGWLGFYATRVPGEELPQTSAIACVHSDDLIQWQHRPPAFAPGNYACLEVPDVFELNGRWYLTCLVGNIYGNRGYFRDPNLCNGTMFAVAERPEGPYQELPTNALLGARTSGVLSCRSLVFEGERHLLYTDREREGHTDEGGLSMGTLTTPKLLKTDGERLYAAYSPRIEKYVEAQLISPTVPPACITEPVWGQIWQMPSARWECGEAVTGQCKSGWGVALFEPTADSFIFEASVNLERGVAAGLAMRVDGHMSGAVVALDAAEQAVVYLEAPVFDWTEKRRTPIRVGQTYHLRIVNRLEHIEVYVNDDLRLAFSRYRGIGGQLGLFVDRGIAHFHDIRLRSLRVTRPA